MSVKAFMIAAIALVLSPLTAPAGEGPDADVSCSPTDEELVYDCMIMLKGKKSGEPIEGAEIVVKANMPSMPMAHNVRPVQVMAIGGPGSYHARLELEMYGEWVLMMDVSGPFRDRIIKKLQFGQMEHGDQGEMKGMGEHKMEKKD